MTVARQVIAGRTYLISRRCTQRQLLLRPDPQVEQIYLYCLGEAAQRYDIALHAFIAMSNHQHLLIRDNHGNFPEFLAHLNKLIAKAMNARLGRWENFWATEQPNAVYLVEHTDRFAKLVYLLANPVAGDLVDRISDWPGASSLALNLSGRGRAVKRPRGFFRANGKMPAEVTLRVERPDGFEHLSDEEWRAMLCKAMRDEEKRARSERRANHRLVLGRKAVLRSSPTDLPHTVEPRRRLRPHIACLDPSRRVRELTALLVFRIERRDARLRCLAGERNVAFPVGTYFVHGFFHRPPSGNALAA
ncbi:MAG TPA: hypothetical protein VM580_07225 [Labilithrix sp.]|jgi:REP element-mobilizing transposase RayT|nr:hypothetical protein [Labilithrix sp.]